MSRIVLLGWACLISFVWVQRPAASELPRRMLFNKYGFSLERPLGWSVRVAEDGLPIFANFPWSKMQPQLRLPAKGAIVNVISSNGIPRRRGDDTLEGWAKLDAVNAAGAVTFTHLEAPPITRISDVLLASFDDATFGPDDQAQHEFNFYWAYRSERFAAHLSYIVGDPRGEEYERMLKQTIFSIRPL